MKNKKENDFLAELIVHSSLLINFVLSKGNASIHENFVYKLK